MQDEEGWVEWVFFLVLATCWCILWVSSWLPFWCEGVCSHQGLREEIFLGLTLLAPFIVTFLTWGWVKPFFKEDSFSDDLKRRELEDRILYKTMGLWVLMSSLLVFLWEHVDQESSELDRNIHILLMVIATLHLTDLFKISRMKSLFSSTKNLSESD